MGCWTVRLMFILEHLVQFSPVKRTQFRSGVHGYLTLASHLNLILQVLILA